MDKSLGQLDRRHIVVVFVLTSLRIPLSITFAIVFLNLEPSWVRVAVGFALVLAADLTDLLDGALARRFGVVTEWGAMIDPYADSVSRLTVYWTLATAGLALAAVPLVMAIRDLTVAYCRITLARQQHTVAAKWSGKIKAHVQAAVALVFIVGSGYGAWMGGWGNVVLSWVVIIATVLSAVEYLRAAISSLSSPRPGPEGI